MPARQVARDISYASSAQTRSGRTLIRVVENATGRIGLIRRAEGYEQQVAQGADFWDVIIQRYGLSLKVVGGDMEYIPREGPLILIANHPYGILDGMMMGHILRSVRGDFRILANQVFKNAEDLNRVVLPVSFDETKEALRTNLETRKKALQFLTDGGAIGVFPGGTVSTAARPFSKPMDPGWRSFTAKMVAKSEAAVVPIFFEGNNSRLFQIASHLHSTLRLALFIKEFKRRIDEPVRVVIGAPISRDRIAENAGNMKQMMDFLRAETYALSPKPLRTLDYGFEFEEKHRTGDERRVY